MRKVTTTVAAALVAFSFAACNKTNNSVTPEEGANSYASVRVNVKNSLKAINDGDQVDNKGTEAESKVSSMALVGAGATWAEGDITNPTGNVYKGKAKPVTVTGPQILGLVLNNNTLAGEAKEAAEYGTSADAVANLAALSTDNNFVMTSKVMSQNIKPNIKEADAETQNMLDFGKVERVVAKGIVQKSADFDETSENGTVPMEGVTYAAVNGATKTYIFANQAGERKLGVEDPNQYKGFKSAIDGIAPEVDDAKAMTAGMIRRGQLDKANLGGYAAKEVKGSAVTDYTDANPGVKEGVYFLENSGEATAANKAEGFYRFAYAKIYATFVPNTVYDIDTTADPEFVAKEGTGKWYIMGKRGKWEQKNPTTAGAKEGQLVYKLKEVKCSKGTTFYMGEKDGRFYLSKNAAAQSTVEGALGQKSFTYTNGRAGYRALWNRQSPDDNEKLVNNASTRRNNIYVLNIKKFQKIGMPWDPSDPNDPDLPKPDDKEEPKYPDNPNIEDQESYVAVQCQMVPWNVIGREVELK